MGEDAFGFENDPFEVMGVSTRSMDEFKSVNSSSTAATRSTTSSRSSRNSSSGVNGGGGGGGGGNSSGDRGRNARKSKSGERHALGNHSDPLADPPAPAPVAAPAPQRTQRARRRASIGVAAAMPAQLAPSPQSDIGGHFEKESNGEHRRARSADADVQSTASGFKNKRAQNVRRGRRASLATSGISARSFDSAPPPTRHQSKPAASTSFDAFGSSDPFANNDAFGGGNEQDYGYGYEDQGTPDYGYGYEDAGPSSKGGDGFSDFAPFAGKDGFSSTTKSSTASSGRLSRPTAIGNHSSSSRGGRDMTIKAPKRSSCLGVGAFQEQKYSAPAPAPSSTITGALDVDLDPFDFSTTAAATPASSAAASRTTNILLPVTAAPVEKAPRPRRRASLMGAMSGAISGTVGAVTAIADVGGAAVGTITGSSNKNSGEKLSDDKKSRRSNANKTSSSKPRRKPTEGTVGASTGVGISAYDGDRDRRRYM